MKLLAVDLEGTIIDDIFSGKILEEKIENLLSVIEEYKPDRIVTFSFALYDLEDFSVWNRIQKQLKGEYNIEIETQDFNISQLKASFLKDRFSIYVYNELDMIQNYGAICKKDLIFEYWCKNNRQHSYFNTFMLLDDVVEDKTIYSKDKIIILKNF
jgi:hypothetical protein